MSVGDFLLNSVAEIGMNHNFVAMAATSGTPSDALTFKHLFELYMAENVIPLEKSKSNFRYFYQKHGSKWADIPITEISKLDVLRWRNETAKESGPQGAQRAFDTFSAIITWAMKFEVIELQQNPCKNIQRLASEPRERFLSLEELENLDRALAEESPLFEDFFLLCLLTGARCGNVLSMRWDNLDLESAMWHIPAKELKGRKAHSIVLTAAAVNLLNQRKSESVSRSPWVFPSPRIDDHLKDPRDAWKRVCKKAGLTNARIHDLRRTLGSFMAMQGESAYIIGKMLGHRDHRSTAVYARLDLKPVRDAAESVNRKWSARIAMPDKAEPRTPKLIQFEPIESTAASFELPAIVTPQKLDTVSQIIIEGKILSALRGGVCTRKGFYKKFSGKEKIHTGELSQVLEGLISKGLVIAYQQDLASNHWRYRLAIEAKSVPEDPKNAELDCYRYTRVKQAPAPLNVLFVEQKILQSIREGKNTKSSFWWKFDGRTRLKGIDLDRILKDMISRGLIISYRKRAGSTRIAYKLAEENPIMQEVAQ